jgi:hypothetical protein
VVRFWQKHQMKTLAAGKLRIHGRDGNIRESGPRV